MSKKKQVRRNEEDEEEATLAQSYENVVEDHAHDEVERLEKEPPKALQVSTVMESGSAQAMLKEISSSDDLMLEGLKEKHGRVNRGQLVANEHAKSVLSDFLFSAGDQSRVLTDFQQQYKQLAVDHSRVEGMFIHYHMQDGGQQQEAGTIVEDAGGVDTLAGDVQRKSAKDASFSADLKGVLDDHRALARAARDVAVAEGAVEAATQGMSSALSNIQAGLVQREAAAPEKRAELRKLTAKIGKIKGYVHTALDLAKKGAAHLGAPEELLGKAEGPVKWLADLAIDSLFDSDVNELETEIAVADTKQHDGAVREQISHLRGAKAEWNKQIIALTISLEAVRGLKSSMSAKTGFLATSADMSGRRDLALIAMFFGETDRFVAQCDVVLGIGKAELDAAAHATEDRRGLATAHGLPYYTAERLHDHDGSRHWIVVRTHEARILGRDYEGERVSVAGDGKVHPWNRGKPTFGYSEGWKSGANPIVAETLETVQAWREQVGEFRNHLGKALALGDMERKAP